MDELLGSSDHDGSLLSEIIGGAFTLRATSAENLFDARCEIQHFGFFVSADTIIVMVMRDLWQNSSAVIQVDRDRWLSFARPSYVLIALTPQEVRGVFADVESLTRDRALHAVGFVAYEAAQAFGLPVHPAPLPVPLAWFGLFDAAHPCTLADLAGGDYQLSDIQPTIDESSYRLGFNRIREHLAAGDTYQANFTFKTRARFEGNPAALFADLVDAQQGKYSAFLDLGRHVICSASPELFFRLEGMEIIARPMKGTSARGRTVGEDVAARLELVESEKQRAENVMIVDMMRNDLGRIADVGSVQVPELFVAERYPHVWQMTSTVKARSLATLADLFAALHPSASVTGAPKKNTMALLAAIEAEPRGVYTGAIGYVPPDGNATFSVAIRTAVIDRVENVVEFGVGSGIVWDSDAGAEYAECLLKGQVLGRRPEVFELLETMKWTPDGGYFLRDRHLRRLTESAEYFGFVIDPADVDRALDQIIADRSEPQRVRLLLSRDGQIRVETTAFVALGRIRAALAEAPVNSRDVLLFHKTTMRTVYERARAARPGYDEVILWNERGEATEGTTTNLVIETPEGLITPRQSSGLLAGTFREAMIDEGRIRESVITVDHLRAAGRIWLINSVHEWREATLEADGQP